MPRSALRRTAYHIVEASLVPWMRSQGRGGGSRSLATPASTSCRSVATCPSLVSMKKTATEPQPSSAPAWRAGLALFDADLRRRGAAEKTRRAYGLDLGDLAPGARGRGLQPPAQT